MKLKLSFLNTLPALPFGSFRIGSEFEIDTKVDFECAELLAMADFFKVPKEQLFLDREKGLLNPFVAQMIINQYLVYIHNYQWSLISGMPQEQFCLPQLPAR